MVEHPGSADKVNAVHRPVHRSGSHRPSELLRYRESPTEAASNGDEFLR